MLHPSPTVVLTEKLSGVSDQNLVAYLRELDRMFCQASDPYLVSAIADRANVVKREQARRRYNALSDSLEELEEG